jgi:hypothetical protein
MQLLKLVQSKVQLGKPLPWNVRDLNGRLLLSTGHVMTDPLQLAELLERGAFVDADEVRALMGSGAPKRPALAPSLFDDWKRLQDDLVEFLAHGLERPDFSQHIEGFATRLIGLLDRDPDIAIYIAVRQDEGRMSIYGITHAMHTGLVGVLMARRIGWPPEQVLTLVKAALTMNLAILPLQGVLAAQDFPPLPRQQAEIRKHPEQTVELLKKAGVTDDDWLQAVALHHERPDGSGYPGGVRDITLLAQALRHADVFMAKISPRVIRPALTIQEAARQLFKEDSGGPIAMAVIKEFGIYPPGNFVQLKSGEQGLVMRRGSHANTPLVAVVTDHQGKPMPHTIQRDTALPEFSVTGPAPLNKAVARLPPERIYGFNRSA